MTINEQLTTIASSMAKVERISLEHADRLLKLLDKAPAEALEMLVRERVKFCWMPAARRLRETFGYSQERILAIR